MNTSVVGLNRSGGFPIEAASGSLFARLRTGMAAVADSVRKRRDISHLQKMPDYILSDIGIDRFEIERAVMEGASGRRGGNLRRCRTGE